MPRRGKRWVSLHGYVVDLPGEQWRDFEDLWEVSSLGRFKAKPRWVPGPRGLELRRERLLVGHGHGPNVVYRYQVDGRPRSVSIYRAMWEAFMGAVPEGRRLRCDGETRLGNLRVAR